MAHGKRPCKRGWLLERGSSKEMLAHRNIHLQERLAHGNRHTRGEDASRRGTPKRGWLIEIGTFKEAGTSKMHTEDAHHRRKGWLMERFSKQEMLARGKRHTVRKAGSWKEAHRRKAGSWKEEHLRNGWLMVRGTPQERLALGRGTLHKRQALRKETPDFKSQAHK
jgi:hypothetical protein